MGTIIDKLNKLLTTKASIKNAIITKGQTVSDDDTFASYADKILAIETGVQLPELSNPASESQVLSGYEFIDEDGIKRTGNIATHGDLHITPGPNTQVFSLEDLYMAGDVYVYGDSNLEAANIKSGVSIFGVSGSYSGTTTTSGMKTVSSSSGHPDYSSSLELFFDTEICNIYLPESFTTIHNVSIAYVDSPYNGVAAMVDSSGMRCVVRTSSSSCDRGSLTFELYGDQGTIVINDSSDMLFSLMAEADPSTYVVTVTYS